MHSVVNDMRSSEAVETLLGLCFPGSSLVLDATYGSGAMWPGAQPYLACDRDPARAPDFAADFRALPLRGGSVEVVVYDPPFQPRTTVGQTAARYSTPVRGVGALRDLVTTGLQECWRVSSIGVVAKCQDYIHDHKPVWMSLWYYEALRDVAGEPYEMMICTRNGKIAARNWQRQLSLRRNQATYWVWRRGRAR